MDRLFFKRAHSFCSHFIHSSFPNANLFALPAPTEEELNQLDTILKQKFHYLAKGTHCFAFLSENQYYVIKLHRFPSHLRLFPWLTHLSATNSMKNEKK